LIRIHPFADGNGRVTRVAKNWILMYDLFPPTFISDATEKKEYIHVLGNSFRDLDKNPGKWNEHIAQFFDLEIERLIDNANHLYEIVERIGNQREKKKIDRSV
jgi:Fic family protein